MNSATADAAITRWTGDAMQSRLRRRYRSERLFKLLGLALFVITLILNLIALTVVRRYREQYE